MNAALRSGRLAAIVFAVLLCGMLAAATAASAATRVTATAGKARGCHTSFVGIERTRMS